MVSTIFGLIVAVLDTIALALIGIPLPVVWGLFSFITNYVPNIGFVIGLIPPALLGLLEGGPWMMLAVIAVYCVINVILQSVIQPKVVGDVVGLTATLSFVSLIFWTWVIGPLGAILAIPLSVLTKAVLLDMDPAAHWLSVLASPGSPPADSPSAGRSSADRSPAPRPVVCRHVLRRHAVRPGTVNRAAARDATFRRPFCRRLVRRRRAFRLTRRPRRGRRRASGPGRW